MPKWIVTRHCNNASERNLSKYVQNWFQSNFKKTYNGYPLLFLWVWFCFVLFFCQHLRCVEQLQEYDFFLNYKSSLKGSVYKWSLIYLQYPKNQLWLNFENVTKLGENAKGTDTEMLNISRETTSWARTHIPVMNISFLLTFSTVSWFLLIINVIILNSILKRILTRSFKQT